MLAADERLKISLNDLRRLRGGVSGIAIEVLNAGNDEDTLGSLKGTTDGDPGGHCVELTVRLRDVRDVERSMDLRVVAVVCSEGDRLLLRLVDVSFPPPPRCSIVGGVEFERVY